MWSGCESGTDGLPALRRGLDQSSASLLLKEVLLCRTSIRSRDGSRRQRAKICTTGATVEYIMKVNLGGAFMHVPTWK
jgi:hypothetical protein